MIKGIKTIATFVLGGTRNKPRITKVKGLGKKRGGVDGNSTSFTHTKEAKLKLTFPPLGIYYVKVALMVLLEKVYKLLTRNCSTFFTGLSTDGRHMHAMYRVTKFVV